MPLTPDAQAAVDAAHARTQARTDARLKRERDERAAAVRAHAQYAQHCADTRKAARSRAAHGPSANAPVVSPTTHVARVKRAGDAGDAGIVTVPRAHVAAVTAATDANAAADARDRARALAAGLTLAPERPSQHEHVHARTHGGREYLLATGAPIGPLPAGAYSTHDYGHLVHGRIEPEPMPRPVEAHRTERHDGPSRVHLHGKHARAQRIPRTDAWTR